MKHEEIKKKAHMKKFLMKVIGDQFFKEVLRRLVLKEIRLQYQNLGHKNLRH